jgi:redox-sensitive bicupin YhaK (pirin superfamily)
LYLDVHLPAGSAFETVVPKTHNAFLYVYRGAVKVGETQVLSRRMGIFSNDANRVKLNADQASRLILVAGCPLNESIVQYGPFVMNTEAEIHQALDDFRSGRFLKGA